LPAAAEGNATSTSALPPVTYSGLEDSSVIVGPEFGLSLLTDARIFAEDAAPAPPPSPLPPQAPSAAAIAVANANAEIVLVIAMLSLSFLFTQIGLSEKPLLYYLYFEKMIVIFALSRRIMNKQGDVFREELVPVR
jgi:hypothetical protein